MFKIKIVFEITKYPRINCSNEELEQLLKIKEHALKIKTHIAKKRKDNMVLYCGIAAIIIMIIQTLLMLKGVFLLIHPSDHFYYTHSHSC